MLILFLISAAIVAYAYVGYPLCLFVLFKLRRRQPPTTNLQPPTSASIIIAAYNEQHTIGRRVRELLDQLSDHRIEGQVIVVSDGSTDLTAAAARAVGSRRVRVIDLPANVGKSAAISCGWAEADYPIVIFADARQRWADDAIPALLRSFADSTVGAVSGELVLEDQDGVMGGVGLYWRYEKLVRRLESQTGSVCGVSGSIAACRRDLFRPVPCGLVLDDIYWPLQVVMQKHRVVFQPEAIAHDRLPSTPSAEFGRKVRTLSGNLQLLRQLPACVLPWKCSLWWRFISHKLLRLAVPWAMLGMFISSAMIGGRLFGGLFIAQSAAYAIALLAIPRSAISKRRIPAAAASFLVLNAAAFAAFWIWITGGTAQSWRKTTYVPALAARNAPAI